LGQLVLHNLDWAGFIVFHTGSAGDGGQCGKGCAGRPVFGK
jgi:hypothetical protein